MFAILKDREVRKIIILALMIRLLIMPFFFHPDIKTHYYHANFLSKGVVNIYQHIEQNKNELKYKDTFNYPPLIYFLLGGWNLIASPVLGSYFQYWLDDWGENVYNSQQIYRQMFVLKAPYLLFDLLIALLLFALAEARYRKKVLVLWLFNPVTLYIIYGLANFDIIPVFFSVLAIYLISKKRLFGAGLALGAGVSTKIYPALYLPFFIIYLLKEKKVSSTFIFLLSCLSLFSITVVFFINDFLKLPQSGLLSKIIEQKITFISNYPIPVFFILYGLLILLALRRKSKFNNLIKDLVNVSLVIVAVANFHPQWFLWGLPFLFLFLVRNNIYLIFFVFLLLGFLLHVLLFKDRYLTVGLFSPVIFSIYNSGFLEELVFSKANIDTIRTFTSLLISLSVLSIIIAVNDIKSFISRGRDE